MDSNTKGTTIEDISYLSRSDHRIPTLVALASDPRSRSELCEMAGVSSSTIRRTVCEFEDRHWIRKNGYQYETTQLGSFIASAMSDVVDRFETERKLRDVWEWLPGEHTGFTLDMCSRNTTVTTATPDNPYKPVNRFISLLDDTDEFRFTGYDVALLEPSKDELCSRILEGMETEIITPPRVAKYMRTTYPELFSEALESGNLSVRLHDDMPSYGVSLFDDHVAISGYDPDSLTVRVLIDTDNPSAREWAESIYYSYRRKTPTVPIESEIENA